VDPSDDPTGAPTAGFRAGAALLAAGRVAAARVAWARAGPPDDPLVAGLVGYAAAVANARRREWDRSRVRATDAARTLRTVTDPEPVAVGPVRAFLVSLATDPEIVERRPPVVPHVAGARPDPDALPLDALARAATATAATDGSLDPDVVDDAVRYAREEVAAGGSAYAALLTDLVAGRSPAVVSRRLGQRVDRRRSEEADVDGLFD
jgi:hypothetical protein